MSKVWLITGTSTGLGRALAEAALAAGHRVAATARKPETLAELTEKYGDSVLALRLDVTDPETIAAAVRATTDKWGRIDVLANNAGYGTIGALEEFTDAQIRAQFDVNFFGAINVLRAALPVLRAQRSGRILNISSLAGFIGIPGSGPYSASKFALEAASEALAGELAPLGIHVTIIQPGGFRTPILGESLIEAANLLPDYENLTGGIRQWTTEMHGKQPGDPDRAARAMIDVTEMENPPLRLTLGGDALGAVRQKLERLKSDFDAYESVSLGTDYPDAVTGAMGG